MGRKAEPTLEQLREEYTNLFAEAVILPNWADRADKAARCIIDARPQLEDASRHTGVPWQVIGVIQCMEAGIKQGSNGVWRLNLNAHMHNGDPLTARTVQVPKGRPLGRPPFTWLESAVDACNYDGLVSVHDWSTALLLYRFEKYNGWGYRWWHPECLSPYLWSGTNLYKRGKYVSDGSYVSTVVSGQIGAAAIMKRIDELGQWLQPASAPAIVGESANAPGYDTWPAATEVRYDETMKPRDLVDAGSRSMGMFEALKVKLVTLFSGMSLYEAASWWSEGKGVVGDVLRLIEAHAAVLFWIAAFTTLVMVLFGRKYLLEAGRDGRYDPNKPSEPRDVVQSAASPLPDDYLRRARNAADMGDQISGPGEAGGGRADQARSSDYMRWSVGGGAIEPGQERLRDGRGGAGS